MSHSPYQHLQTSLSALISNSPAGTRLPAEPELARELGVSRATLREAMRMFESQGMIRRRQGAGTFVVGRELTTESGLEVLESIEHFLQRNGAKVSVESALVAPILADEIHAVILGVLVKAPLLQVSRVVRSDMQPVAYLVDTISDDILRATELTNNFNGSVLDFLVQRGDAIISSRAEICAVAASEELAGVFETQRGVPLLQFSEKLYSSTNRVMSYSVGYFLPGHFNFYMMRRAKAG
jgi:GntR family transcriptional regulator